MELKIDRLTKQYSNKIAVDRVSCTLSPGDYAYAYGLRNFETNKWNGKAWTI